MRHGTLFVWLALPAAFAFNAAAAQPGLEEFLSYDLTELMNVEVVSASKMPQPASEAPATVRVITAEEIRERGFLTLEEALSNLPGFQFRDIAGFNSYVFLRGLPNQNNLILVLVDGVQINELNSGGFYGGAQYNLANVKRIEVVYGPASALYGTNAMSGIINIITNDPRDLQGGGWSALTGGFGTRALDFRYGRQNGYGGPGLSFSGKLLRTDKQDLRGAKGDNNWSQDMENFERDWAFDGKAVYKDLTLGVVVQDKQSSRATNDKTAGTGFLDSGTNWHIRFANIWLKHVYDRNAGWSVDSRLYYRTATVMDDTISAVYDSVCSTCGQQGQYRPNDLIGLESQVHLKPVEDLDLTCGAVAEHENLARYMATSYSGDPLVSPAAPPYPPLATNELLSLYAEAGYQFIPGLRLTGGLRYDNSSSYGKVNTPRAGLIYNQDQLTLKMLYGEAFRAPRPWDYTYGPGNPHLSPETLRSAELSGGYVFSSHLKADVSLYRNKLDGLLALSGGRWVNSGGVETSGLETQIEFARGGLKAYLNYTFQNSEYRSGANVAEIGRDNAGAGALYAFSGKTKLDLRARYLGRRKNTKTITATGSDFVGAALVTDATLSLTELKGFDIRLMAKNLFNGRYYHTSNRDPDRYRQPGRQFLIQAAYAFGGPERP